MTTFLILVAVLALFAFLLSDASWNNVLSGARNDLVFQGRHQAYGAYPLRRAQHRTVIFAFSAASGLLLAGVGLPKLNQHRMDASPIPPRDPGEHVVDILIPETERTTTTTAVRTENQEKSPVYVAIDTLDQPPDTTSQADPAGPKGDGLPVDSASNGGGGGKLNIVVDSLPKKPVILDWVPHPPEFPGGEKGLQGFWGNNVNFEPWMLGGKPELLVYVQFVVDVNGNVTQAEMVRSAGADLDREVLLAVKCMPDWKPGRMGEEEVAVRLKQPIRLKVR